MPAAAETLTSSARAPPWKTDWTCTRATTYATLVATQGLSLQCLTPLLTEASLSLASFSFQPCAPGMCGVLLGSSPVRTRGGARQQVGCWTASSSHLSADA